MHESRHRAAVSPSPREGPSGWVLEAVFPNGKQATIAGFGSESEANEWLGSVRHIAWLRGTRAAFSLRAVVAAFEWLFALALVYIAGLARRAGKWRSAGWLRSVCWFSILYRCLFAATVALLTLSAVIAILAAAVAPLGRNEQPAGLGAGKQISAAMPVAQARSSEVAEVSDPIAALIDRVSSADAKTEPPIGIPATPHKRQ